MPFVRPAAVLVAVVAASTAPRADELRFAERGFAVTPPAGWVATEGADPASGTGAVTAHPAGPDRSVALTVKVLPDSGLETEEAFRAALLASERDKPEHLSIEETTFRLAGEESAGIEVDTRSGGTVFRVRQAYALRDGEAFLVQAYAPRDRFAALAGEIDAWFSSFRWIEATGERAERRRLRRLAAGASAAFGWPGWAPSWEEAAARARRERKLVLAYARFQPGFDIADAMVTGPFSDPAIVDLVRHRFVPVRLRKEVRTPLHDRERYGLSGTSFGVSILLCRPDGEVVREGFAAERAAVWDLLVDALARAPEAVGEGAPADSMAPVERARRHVARGELDLALRALDGARGAEAARTWSRVRELQRRGRRALLWLFPLLASADHLDVRIDGARVLMRLGHGRHGIEGLKRFESLDHPRRAEALYLLGEAWRSLGAPGLAMSPWRTAIDEHPDSPWAARAAAAGTDPALALGGGDRQSWPEEELLESIRPSAPAPLPVARADDAARDAIAYLVRHQREDGSWPVPMEVRSRGESRHSSPFVVAVAAIAVRGLLPHRGEEAAADALDAAVRYLEAERDRRRADPPPTAYMDYQVWSLAYELLALSDALDAGLLDRDEGVAAMEELVADLATRRQANGGWSYYLSASVDGPRVAQSISFVTAAVTAALLRAREAGAAVDGELVSGALDALDAMRNDERTFEYFLHVDSKAAARATAAPGAAGRGPLCELVRLRGGRGDVAAVRAALDLWRTHQAPLAAEAGKALMHSGDHGQGCHYVLFDYAWIAAAIDALPEPERPTYRHDVVRRILETRTADGGFVDAPFLGRAYGAGMALCGLGRSDEGNESPGDQERGR